MFRPQPYNNGKTFFFKLVSFSLHGVIIKTLTIIVKKPFGKQLLKKIELKKLLKKFKEKFINFSKFF